LEGSTLRTLIVGYGNPDRQDDGAAWHALYRLADRLERPLPPGPEEGFIPEDEEPDLWFVLQLTPEMAETFAQYERILFIDAHTGQVPHDLLLQPVAQVATASSLTHHLSPAACMALVKAIYFRSPQAALLTIRGYSFQFSREMTRETDALVTQAVEMVQEWMGKDI
jgi:hydrogenase maturation protease